jgi:hypothetical protein
VLGHDWNFRTYYNGTSAWLFAGTNTSYPKKPASSTIFDLRNIPATFNATGWPVWSNYSSTGLAYLVSVLLCNPIMNLSSGRITFSPASNTLSVSSDTLHSVGNIDIETAMIALAQSLLDVTMIEGVFVSSSRSTAVSTLSAQLFLGSSNNLSLPTRSLSDMSSSLNKYVSFATKAWSDGYRSPGIFSTITVDGVTQEEKLVLMASVSFTVAAGVLAVLVLVLTAAELRVKQGKPLGIRSLEEAFGEIQLEDMSLVTLPLRILRG